MLNSMFTSAAARHAGASLPKAAMLNLDSISARSLWTRTGRRRSWLRPGDGGGMPRWSWLLLKLPAMRRGVTGCVADL